MTASIPTTDSVPTSTVGTGSRSYNDSSNDSCGGRPLVNVTVDAGPGAKGDKGDPGATGESAYQIALDNGFVGTEAEWLASLKGAPGSDAAVDAETAVPTSLYPSATLGSAVDAALSSASAEDLTTEVTRATEAEAALAAKTADLSADGSSYSGGISGASLSTTMTGAQAAAQIETNTTGLADEIARAKEAEVALAALAGAP